LKVNELLLIEIRKLRCSSCSLRSIKCRYRKNPVIIRGVIIVVVAAAGVAVVVAVARVSIRITEIVDRRANLLSIVFPSY